MEHFLTGCKVHINFKSHCQFWITILSQWNRIFSDFHLKKFCLCPWKSTGTFTWFGYLATWWRCSWWVSCRYKCQRNYCSESFLEIYDWGKHGNHGIIWLWVLGNVLKVRVHLVRMVLGFYTDWFNQDTRNEPLLGSIHLVCTH